MGIIIGLIHGKRGQMLTETTECRETYEKYCLEYGYSLDGHDRAEGRWAGWQAAWETCRALTEIKQEI